MAYSGQYNIQNPEKYLGDPSNIIYRSLWEKKLMKWLDHSDSVLSWSSEELIIPYFLELDRKNHRYFPDFKATIVDINGNIDTYIIEVKPRSQIEKPKDPGRRSTRYLNECKTWITNQEKWKAASAYAKERGWKFIVMDEYHLGIEKPKKKK